MPKLYYLDSSSLLDIFERNGDQAQLLAFLSANDGCLGLSEEVFYEIATPNLDPREKSQRRRTISSILSGNIPLKFLKKRGALKDLELHFLKMQEPATGIDYQKNILPEKVKSVALMALSTKYNKIAKGDPKRILPQHRANVIKQSQEWFQQIHQMNDSEKLAKFNLSEALEFPDFDLLRAALSPTDVDDLMLESFIRYRSTYRTVDAMYRAFCYFFSRVPCGSSHGPRKDIVTDVAHLIEAAYADVLVTTDKKQILEAAKILPHVQAIYPSQLT